MLYISDLGNVTIDIDFNWVSGAWSDLVRIPLATLEQHFIMGEAFHQHERGGISDEDFAVAMCHETNMSLNYEQFAHGWQVVLVAPRPEVIVIMYKLRAREYRVVVLSNINRLHTTFWSDEYPGIRAAVDCTYLSQEIGLRKSKAEIHLRVLEEEGSSVADTVFFDDNVDNIAGANRLGITNILVTGRKTIPDYFANQLC